MLFLPIPSFIANLQGLIEIEFLPSVWDSRHLISFAGGYKLSRNWEISARYRFAGRTPFVPVDEAATLNSYPEIVLDYGRLGEETLDIFSQLDLRIDKKWNFRSFSLNLFAEVQNVLSQDIPSPPEYGLARDMDGAILDPRQLVQIEPGEGQFIPSIGIVVDF